MSPKKQQLLLYLLKNLQFLKLRSSKYFLPLTTQTHHVKKVGTVAHSKIKRKKHFHYKDPLYLGSFPILPSSKVFSHLFVVSPPDGHRLCGSRFFFSFIWRSSKTTSRTAGPWHIKKTNSLCLGVSRSYVVVIVKSKVTVGEETRGGDTRVL